MSERTYCNEEARAVLAHVARLHGPVAVLAVFAGVMRRLAVRVIAEVEAAVGGQRELRDLMAEVITDLDDANEEVTMDIVRVLMNAVEAEVESAAARAGKAVS